MLGAAIGVAEEVVDGTTCFLETGAGEFDLEMAAAFQELFFEAIEQVVLFGRIIEGDELDLAEERHGVADLESGFDGVGESEFEVGGEFAVGEGDGFGGPEPFGGAGVGEGDFKIDSGLSFGGDLDLGDEGGVGGGGGVELERDFPEAGSVGGVLEEGF